MCDEMRLIHVSASGARRIPPTMFMSGTYRVLWLGSNERLRGREQGQQYALSKIESHRGWYFFSWIASRVDDQTWLTYSAVSKVDGGQQVVAVFLKGIFGWICGKPKIQDVPLT